MATMPSPTGPAPAIATDWIRGWMARARSSAWAVGAHHVQQQRGLVGEQLMPDREEVRLVHQLVTAEPAVVGEAHVRSLGAASVRGARDARPTCPAEVHEVHDASRPRRGRGAGPGRDDLTCRLVARCHR